MIRIEGARVWDVRYSLPPTEKVKWRQNKHAIVVATSAAEALTVLDKAAPGASVHAVHCRSSESSDLFMQEVPPA